ncbi:hypothetical protein [uncultured Desulfovibrio sp.]|uniref:hypothetical protein n=1 Tax=uncultured Desulfovibrio sp. TaxID=167968 RepID=UPI0003AA0347|nr:hypothetical protein [uncultured Desulfovibrio sp.]
MMLAAAFFGMLQPALELALHLEHLTFLPIVAGLLLGAAFLWCLDRVLSHIHMLQNTTEGLSTSWRRSILLVAATTLHPTSRRAWPSAQPEPKAWPPWAWALARPRPWC